MLKNKSKTFYLTILLVVLLVLLLIIFVVNALFNPNNPRPSLVSSVEPSSAALLLPGTNFSFKVTFVKPVDLTELSISLKQQDTTKKNSISPVSFTTSMNSENTVMEVKLAYPTQSLVSYTLTITDNTNKYATYNVSFLTASPTPTAIINNNNELKKSLPYTTKTFSLTYSATSNIYIFNFKYNALLAGDVDQQYAKAKEDAISYIKSKGVDLNTVTIQWNEN